MNRMRTSFPTLKLRSAYTIVELMIVTTILGVVSVMSMGRISTYVQERHVSAAAATVHNDLQQAFTIAARNRRPVRITFATADTALRITNRENTITYLRRGLGAGSGFALRPSDVVFCAATCSGATIEVYPNGWASDTLTVTITKGQYSRGVRMSRSGLFTAK
jgi:Tfp pilus assembly protein FimT